MQKNDRLACIFLISQKDKLNNLRAKGLSEDHEQISSTKENIAKMLNFITSNPNCILEEIEKIKLNITDGLKFINLISGYLRYLEGFFIVNDVKIVVDRNRLSYCFELNGKWHSKTERIPS